MTSERLTGLQGSSYSRCNCVSLAPALVNYQFDSLPYLFRSPSRMSSCFDVYDEYDGRLRHAKYRACQIP